MKLLPVFTLIFSVLCSLFITCPAAPNQGVTSSLSDFMLVLQISQTTRGQASLIGGIVHVICTKPHASPVKKNDEIIKFLNKLFKIHLYVKHLSSTNFQFVILQEIFDEYYNKSSSFLHGSSTPIESNIQNEIQNKEVSSEDASFLTVVHLRSNPSGQTPRVALQVLTFCNRNDPNRFQYHCRSLRKVLSEDGLKAQAVLSANEGWSTNSELFFLRTEYGYSTKSRTRSFDAIIASFTLIGISADHNVDYCVESEYTFGILKKDNQPVMLLEYDDIYENRVQSDLKKTFLNSFKVKNDFSKPESVTKTVSLNLSRVACNNFFVSLNSDFVFSTSSEAEFDDAVNNLAADYERTVITRKYLIRFKTFITVNDQNRVLVYTILNGPGDKAALATAHGASLRQVFEDDLKGYSHVSFTDAAWTMARTEYKGSQGYDYEKFLKSFLGIPENARV